MTRNERVPAKLSVFAEVTYRPSRRIIKDCLKFVACRGNFVRRWNTRKTRNNRCLSPFDKSVPRTDFEFAIAIESTAARDSIVSYATHVLI